MDGRIEQADSADRSCDKGIVMTDQELARILTEREEMRKKGRECPVPKPGGWVGQWLGFRAEGSKAQSLEKRAGKEQT